MGNKRSKQKKAKQPKNVGASKGGSMSFEEMSTPQPVKKKKK